MFSNFCGMNRCISWMICSQMLRGLSDVLFAETAQLWFGPCKVGILACETVWRSGHGRWLPWKAVAGTWGLSLLHKVFMAQLRMFMDFYPMLSHYIRILLNTVWLHFRALPSHFAAVCVVGSVAVDEHSGHFYVLKKAFRESKEQWAFPC